MVSEPDLSEGVETYMICWDSDTEDDETLCEREPWRIYAITTADREVYVHAWLTGLRTLAVVLKLIADGIHPMTPDMVIADGIALISNIYVPIEWAIENAVEDRRRDGIARIQSAALRRAFPN